MDSNQCESENDSKSDSESERECTCGNDDFHTIAMHFDGACTGNNTRGIRNAAVGVYGCSYNCLYNKSIHIGSGELFTNNIAEIVGATELLTSAYEACCSNQNINTVHVRGDSKLVISTVLSGAILSYKSHCRLPNSNVWFKLRQAIEKISESGIHLIWTWIPRVLNQEANQLAGCAISKNKINKNIISTPPDDGESDELTSCCIDLLRKRRTAFIRSLPESLAKQWCIIASGIISSCEGNQIAMRKTFLLLPLLLAAGPVSGGMHFSKTNFKKMRQHLAMLIEPNYRMSILSEWSKQNYKPPPDGGKMRFKCDPQSLCAKGLYDQCIKTNDIVVTSVVDAEDANFKRLQSMFIARAESSNIVPIPIKEAQMMTYADTTRAYRRLKAGKAPGVTGYTKETMSFILNTHLSSAITNIFCALINTAISEEEMDLLSTSRTVPFYYPDKQKDRPVLIADFVSKVVWRHVIDDENKVKDLLQRTGHVAYLRKGCELACAAVGRAIEQGKTIVLLDSTNAFPTAQREAIITEIGFFWKAAAWFNLHYVRKSQAVLYAQTGVLTFDTNEGTKQGCTSGSLFYCVSTSEPSRKAYGKIAQVVDDVAVLEDALNTAPGIILDFAAKGQIMTGKKMRIIVPAGTNIPQLKTTLHPILATATIIEASSVFMTLGSFFATSRTSKQTFLTAVQPWYKTKVSDRLDLLDKLDTTKQNKLLILRNLNRYFQYHASTFHLPTALRDHLFASIDNDFITFVKRLFPSHQIRDPHVHLLQSFEDGGLGFRSYEKTHAQLHAKALIGAEDFCKMFNFAPSQHTLQSLLEPHNTTTPGFDRRISSDAFPSIPNFWIARPMHHFVCFDDETMDFVFGIHVGSFKVRSFICPVLKHDLAKLAPRVYFEHISSCQSCGAITWHTRHNRAVLALSRSLRFHSILNTPNPTSLPLPGNNKGGCDVLITGLGSSAIAVDVSIVRTEPLRQDSRRHLLERYTFKKNLYQEFSNLTGFKASPFICNIQGHFHRKTLDDLWTWTQGCYRRSEAFHSIANVFVFEMLKGFKISVDTLHARFHQQLQLSVTVGPIPAQSATNQPQQTLQLTQQASQTHQHTQNSSQHAELQTPQRSSQRIPRQSKTTSQQAPTPTGNLVPHNTATNFTSPEQHFTETESHSKRNREPEKTGKKTVMTSSSFSPSTSPSRPPPSCM